MWEGSAGGRRGIVRGQVQSICEDIVLVSPIDSLSGSSNTQNRNTERKQTLDVLDELAIHSGRGWHFRRRVRMQGEGNDNSSGVLSVEQEPSQWITEIDSLS